MIVATATATAAEMTLDGNTPGASNRYTLVDYYSYGLTITVHAREDTGANHALFKRMAIIQETGGVVSMVGAVQTIGTDINPAGWALTIDADTTNLSLQILVTGAAGQNIHWIAQVEALELYYTNTAVANPEIGPRNRESKIAERLKSPDLAPKLREVLEKMLARRWNARGTKFDLSRGLDAGQSDVH